MFLFGLGKLSRENYIRRTPRTNRGCGRAAVMSGISSSRQYLSDGYQEPYVGGRMVYSDPSGEQLQYSAIEMPPPDYSGSAAAGVGSSKSGSSISSSSGSSSVGVSRRPHPAAPPGKELSATDSNRCCGSHWFIRDCCGIVCVVITYMLILYAEFVVMCVLLLPGPSYLYTITNAIIFHFFTFLAVASHVKTMITDPGAVPKFRDLDIYNKELLERLGLLREGQIVLKCAKCANIKPERAHHCSVCRRCIRKMDHHCPWVNNCVGEKNQKFFVLFTMYIAIISCHALILVASQAFICSGIDWSECTGFSPPTTVVLLMILVFEGLLFFIFTLIMCITQLQSICYDETGIEKLKKECRGRHVSKLDSLREVFGSTFSIRWFSPFDTPRVLSNVPYWYTV